MSWRKTSFVVPMLVASVLVSVPLQADPIQWYLSDVTFSDGATASGMFTYDAALDTYSAWDILVTAGLLPAYNYLPVVDGGFMGVHSASQVDFVAFPPTGGRYIRLTFASPLTDAGGTALLLTDNSGWDCNNCSTRRLITGGSVSSVPEVSNLALLSSVLVMIGLFRRISMRGKTRCL